MKVAIHTLIGHYNYGCILQAYALQTTLEKMGHNVTVINRRENKPETGLLFQRYKSVLKSIVKRYVLGDKRVAIGNPYDYFYFQRNIDFSLLKEFAFSKLHYSKLFRSSSSLNKFVRRERFDAYIVGSDQVWREAYAPDILDSFFGYLPLEDDAIRISYAASFGTTELPISKEKLPRCIELAKKFHGISVREKSGVGLVNEHFGLDAVHVLDPTFLLDVAEYKELIKDNNFGNKKLVSYILDNTEEKKEIVGLVSTSLNVESLNLMDYPLNEEGRQRPYSVENWLAAISNAEFVVTDSFHGCVFSIIFQRPFVCIGNKGRGMARFSSLLKMFGLEDRLVTSIDDFKTNKITLKGGVDYKHVNSILLNKKKESIMFLEYALKNALWLK